MEELMRTNNAVSISFAAALLTEQGIVHFVADTNMSVLEGSIGIMPRRVMVDGDALMRARKLMEDAGLGYELPDKLVRELDR